VNGSLRTHILEVHGEAAFRKAVLADKERGMSDPEIGERYGISFATLEQFITEAYGANVSVLRRPRHLRRWQPSDFREETTTVWSFKQRGDWATHHGYYRGNWSPYIPRNVILKYSQPGDTVLDYFVGGGTTAIEAKLLGRRCIARDINPDAISMTLESLEFSPPRTFLDDAGWPVYEPEVHVGDARDLSDIPANSIDLICAHPPYAGIIQYSVKIAGDLSGLSVQDFLTEMGKVARESWRVLKPGGKCAILIGDARRSKHVVPIGFKTIRVFLDAGFALRELVIKRQHNCRTTGFWYTRSIQHNFLLLAHEYLPIFEKPVVHRLGERGVFLEHALPRQITWDQVRETGQENLETTTVWIFPRDRLDAEIKRNLLGRFALPGNRFGEMHFAGDHAYHAALPFGRDIQLLYVHSPRQLSGEIFANYRIACKGVMEEASELLSSDGFLVLETVDFRSGNDLIPVALLLSEDMASCEDFDLKEIIIVVPEEAPRDGQKGYLDIVHRYLLVYARRKARGGRA